MNRDFRCLRVAVSGRIACENNVSNSRVTRNRLGARPQFLGRLYMLCVCPQTNRLTVSHSLRQVMVEKCAVTIKIEMNIIGDPILLYSYPDEVIKSKNE